MTLQERLAQLTGVWEGSYTHLTPAGEVLDRHTSRQETRMEGKHWFERVIYRWPARTGESAREQVLDFRAEFDVAGERLLFADAAFTAETLMPRPDILIFPYFWHARPEQRVVETIVFSSDTQKSRIWQSFDRGELVRVTVIVERRTNEPPAIW